MKKTIIFFACLLLFGACGQLDQLHHQPPISPAQWCEMQPCVNLANQILIQPSSSIIVYFLAFLSVAIGLHFVKQHQQQSSRYWWGASLVLGGIGAFLAGTSFQAFGYEIKCADRATCLFTSWWELWYNMFTVAGAGALLVAIAYSCMSLKWQQRSKWYALISTFVYIVVVLTGAFLPNHFLVSFELMLLFIAPVYLAIILFNMVQYIQNPTKMLAALLGSWVLLIITIVAYYAYLMAGYTQSLWAKGIWFSENDVLHVGMIIWLIYVAKVLGKYVVDVVPFTTENKLK